jgi:sugar fermentation stimulation protein
LPDTLIIRPEYVYGQSRLDFYVETKEKRCLVEVKGVTLEEAGFARFPDAPTLRGAKHLRELTEAVHKGYECYAFFVIQLRGVHSFSPNEATDPSFAKALKTALDAGVHVLAYDCNVREDFIEMGEPVPVFV